MRIAWKHCNLFSPSTSTMSGNLLLPPTPQCFSLCVFILEQRECYLSAFLFADILHLFTRLGHTQLQNTVRNGMCYYIFSLLVNRWVRRPVAFLLGGDCIPHSFLHHDLVLWKRSILHFFGLQESFTRRSFPPILHKETYSLVLWFDSIYPPVKI